MGILKEAKVIAKVEEDKKIKLFEEEQQALRDKADATRKEGLAKETLVSKSTWDYLETRFNYTDKDRACNISYIEKRLTRDEQEKVRLGYTNLTPFYDEGIFVFVEGRIIKAERRCSCSTVTSSCTLYSKDRETFKVSEKTERSFLEQVGNLGKGQRGFCASCQEEDRRRSWD